MAAGMRQRLEPVKDAAYSSLAPGRGPHFVGDANATASRADAIPPSGGPPCSDPAFVGTDLLDKNNIDVAILLPVQPAKTDRWTDPDEAAAVCAAYNRYMVDHWLSADSRFRLGMVVSGLDPDKAAHEIQAFGNTPGVVGVWLPVNNTLFGSRYYHPIYKAAQDLGLPIVMHPTGTEGDYIGGPQFAGGATSSRAGKYSLGSELAMSNLVSLIFQGTFEQFPELKVTVTEFGWSWVPSLLWRMDETWKSARVLHPWMRRSPTEYVLDHVRFTTQPVIEIPKSHVPEFLEMVHASEILLFASDYPHWDSDEPRSVFKTVAAPVRERIFYRNALEWFGERLNFPREGLSKREPH
jgi:predicted TIM-barrel fold metal-dependent hydrolase